MTSQLLLASAAVICLFGAPTQSQYLGKFLGKLSELHHGVSGEVYAVDGRTLHIKDFTYDGQGPSAYFYASTYKAADSRGFRLRDENNKGEVIRRYRKEGITLTLPEGKTLNNIKIFYVWCEEFDVNFGDVKIPRSFDYPRPQKISPLKGVHAISSDNIVIVDAQTLLIPNLSYDGEAPDAKFWVGRGSKPSPQGVRVPDENGKEVPLRRYDKKTVVLTLPGDLTVFDIGHFGIWCEEFTVDFGHIQIQQPLNVPPSLRMLGVSPQSKLNCEVLSDELAFEVRWAVAGESIVLQLVAKLDDREYMSFGLSGDDSRSVMIGGDVVVAWVDKQTLKGFAQDYYLAEKSQCSGPTGSCPDNRLEDNTDSIRLLNAAMVNGYSIVTYQRPLRAADKFDLEIYTNRSQAIIWAIGPLNQRDEVSFHNHYLKKDSFIKFGRPAHWNCPIPENEQTTIRPLQQSQIISTVPPEDTSPSQPEAVTRNENRQRNNERRRGGNRGSTKQQVTEPTPNDDDSERSASNKSKIRNPNRGVQRGENKSTIQRKDAWKIPPIQCDEPEDGVFYSQMGPTGGKRGYPAITGHVGWGISWYINGLLIPEIHVVRGKTYTFVVEGGIDPEVSAKYHPFYITDDPVGGYAYKTPEEREEVQIFAGASTNSDGTVIPTGTGRLCHWTPTSDLEADDFESFGAYQRTLELKCDQGEPGVIQWTPDKDTPETVYYQCFTHRHLGWKIHVHNNCDESTAASEQHLAIAESASLDLEGSDLVESQSVQVETRVKLNDYATNDGTNTLKQSLSEQRKPNHLDSKTKQKQPVLQRRRNVDNKTYIPKTSMTDIIKNRSFNQPQLNTMTRIHNFDKTVSETRMGQKFYTTNLDTILNSDSPVTQHSMKVEIYPVQASTEKEPATLLINTEMPEIQSEKNINSELDDIDADIEVESQVGVIKISNDTKLRLKTRSLVDEPIAAAAEKINSYYLPPPTASRPIQKPQHTDIEPPFKVDLAVSPPDIVVTYDGKKVSGASLTAKPFERSHIFEQKISHSIRAKPQYVPYKGELPPLDAVYANSKNVPQYKKAKSLNRGLDVPQETTKLRRVRRHHTPEHTAQQQRNNETMANRASVISFRCYLSLIMVAFVFLSYL